MGSRRCSLWQLLKAVATTQGWLFSGAAPVVEDRVAAAAAASVSPGPDQRLIFGFQQLAGLKYVMVVNDFVATAIFNPLHIFQ